MTSIEGNVRKNYLFVFLSSVSLSEAIWMLYLGFRGMSLVQIGLLESIFHATSLFMEIPTGIIADRFGRKTSRILGRVMAMLGTLLMIASGGFWEFAAAFVLTALGYNLESGAGDALVYDSLLQCGKEAGYMKVKGRQEIAYQAAQMSSLVGSGIVATFDYTLAYLLTLGIHGASLLLSFSFKEPLIGRAAASPADRPESPGREAKLIRHMKESFRALRENGGILKYILFLEGFALFQTTLYFYFQSFLKSVGYIEWKIGLILALSALAGMIAGANTYRLEKKLGERRLVSLSPFAAIIAFALIGFSPLEVPAMILLSVIEGILFVSFSDYINRLIPSSCRATLLSFQAMAFSLMMVVFFPLVGGVASAMGFKPAFIMIFAFSVPVLLLARGLLLRGMTETR
jgi:MFS family permease